MARRQGEESALGLPRRGEFPALWVSEAASVVGDQLAKVAVALLVYDRTGSAGWSGAAYAATFLAPLIAGPLLAGLADRYPRRTLMVTCSTLQGLIIAAMAIPGMPLLVLLAGVMCVAVLQIPFKGAQGAAVLQILADYRIEHHGVASTDDARMALNSAGRARLMLVREVGQLAGLGGGAAVVLAIGTTWALVVDAATFVVAAVVLRLWLRARSASAPGTSTGFAVFGELGGQLWAFGRQVRADRLTRALVIIVALIGFTAAPDAVVVPLADELGAGRWAVGWLLAADCVGVIAGSRWLERQTGDRKRRLIVPLALVSMVPLALFWASLHSLAVVLALLIVSGVGATYYSPAVADLTERVDDGIAGTTNGLMSVLLRASQGLGALTAGILAEISSAVMAVAILGTTGVLLTGVCAVQWRRSNVLQPVRRPV
ncbi:MFS transporter [Amycolatopsis roodepoortensis]|uniref:MFS family permease n=1 Tax=Amycolatopsis roodepoortensis TaxID=700274 RepID=A0ABR9LIQ0_9PSEU|nr:MFS transporter [Amycolatopsis roodepoortensis]MBE1580539.1 MFS family permease [Amycolatopsis roodepoortensis]